MSGVLLLASQTRIVASNPVTWLCDQELRKRSYISCRPNKRGSGDGGPFYHNFD